VFDPRSRKSSDVLDLRPRCPGGTPDISRLAYKYKHQRLDPSVSRMKESRKRFVSRSCSGRTPHRLSPFTLTMFQAMKTRLNVSRGRSTSPSTTKNVSTKTLAEFVSQTKSRYLKDVQDGKGGDWIVAMGNEAGGERPIARFVWIFPELEFQRP
jgi:hypothetical protein